MAPKKPTKALKKSSKTPKSSKTTAKFEFSS